MKMQIWHPIYHTLYMLHREVGGDTDSDDEEEVGMGSADVV